MSFGNDKDKYIFTSNQNHDDFTDEFNDYDDEEYEDYNDEWGD